MILKIETNTDLKNLLEHCNELLVEVKNNYNFQLSRKQTLLLCIDKLSNTIDNVTNVTNVNLLLNMIDKFKTAFEKINYNIEKYKSLDDILIKLKNIIDQGADNNDSILSVISSFNEYYKSFQKTITENNIEIENCIQNYINECNFTINNYEKQSQSINITEEDSNSKDLSNNTSENFNIETSKDDTINLIPQETVHKEITDNNILLISEKQKKVFLPYKKSELEQILKKNKSKYKDLEDLINKQYIVPLSRFSSPVLSRFKEAFHLMKDKEKASLTEALDLAFELSFYRSLNPAIIAACKSLDELDIYLDYLDNNELDKFTIFTVQYDISPRIKDI